LQRRQAGQRAAARPLPAGAGGEAAVHVRDPQQLDADALAMVDRHRRQGVRIVRGDRPFEREVTGQQRGLADQPLGALGHEGAEDVTGGVELPLQTVFHPAVHRRADHPQRRQQDGEDERRERQEDLCPQPAPPPPGAHS
jgi:hypothetical protein